MVLPYWLLITKWYGFTPDDIGESCPTDLKPYEDAYSLKMKQRDAEMWSWFGRYGTSAVSVAVDHILNGHKATSEYVKQPITREQEAEERNIQKQRELFVAQLEAMKTNFELSHPKKNK